MLRSWVQHARRVYHWGMTDVTTRRLPGPATGSPSPSTGSRWPITAGGIERLLRLGLHRRVVGGDRRARRSHPAGPGRGLGSRPAAGGGHPPRLHPGSGAAGPERGGHGRGRPGPVHPGHRHLVGRDRAPLERRGLRRALQAGPGHHPVPAVGAGRREGRPAVRHLPGPGLPAGPPGRAPAPDLPGRPAAGDAPAGRPGGRRRHHQLAVRRGRGHGHAGAGRRHPGGGPDLRLPVRGRPTRCGPWAAG